MSAVEHNNFGSGASVHTREIAIGRFEPLIGTTEAAKLLDIHPKTLQRMARAHVIPGHQIGSNGVSGPLNWTRGSKMRYRLQCHSCR